MTVLIRPEQCSVLSAASESEFVERLAEFISTEFDDADGLSREELRFGVSRQMTNSREYGLATERQIYTYVITTWLLGEDFDKEFPAALLVLNAEDYTADEKSEWLAAWTAEMLHNLDV